MSNVTEIKRRRQAADRDRNRGLITAEDHRRVIRALQAECDHEWKIKTEPRGSGTITTRFCESCGANQ